MTIENDSDDNGCYLNIKHIGSKSTLFIGKKENDATQTKISIREAKEFGVQFNEDDKPYEWMMEII